MLTPWKKTPSETIQLIKWEVIHVTSAKKTTGNNSNKVDTQVQTQATGFLFSQMHISVIQETEEDEV